MKTKLRSVNTRFWDDPFIEELNPSEKLLFLYFLTNSLTNLLGIYEITIKRITFDTGLTRETILKALKGFEIVGKVFYIDGFIILPNFLKNQRLNPNMVKNAISEFNELPEWLKNKLLGNGKETVSNGLETISNALQTIRKEEGEEEKELKKKKEVFLPPTKDDVISYFKENGYTKEAALKAFKYYDTAGWKDSKGNKVRNWKQKMIAVWFKDENKIQAAEQNRQQYQDLSERFKNTTI